MNASIPMMSEMNNGFQRANLRLASALLSLVVIITEAMQTMTTMNMIAPMGPTQPG
jgi:hypothetical protein